MRYIPNGVPELPPGDRASEPRELGLGADEPVVGTVGAACARRRRSSS